MNYRHVTLLISVLVLSGCPIRQKAGLDDDASASDTSADIVDAETMDGAEAGAATTLTITSPAPNAYTNGTLVGSVAVGGGGQPPGQITIVANGNTVATVSASFQFSWDTVTVAEGPYSVVAQATIAGTTITSSPVVITVDRTPPKIMHLTPASGASGVVLSAPMQAVFSEALLPASVTSSAIALAIGTTSISTTVSLSADGKTATLVIKDRSSLSLPAMFSAAFAANITDLAGNKLVQPATAWSWSVPDWIKLPTFPAGMDPVLRVGSDLRPVVAYATLSMPNGNFIYTVEVAQYDGQTWTLLSAPTTSVNTGADGYSLELDAENRPTVAWTFADVADVNVHAASWNGSEWAELPAVDGVELPGTNADMPRVRLDGMGHPIVAWRESTGTGSSRNVFVARWNGTAWDQPYGNLGLDTVPELSGVALVLDSQGNPVVGWETSPGGGVSTWSSTWTQSPILPASNDPSIALDVLDRPLAVERGATTDVYRLVGAEWQAATSTPVPVGTSSQNPILAVTPDHAPVVAWLDTTGPYKIGLARWTGASWDVRFGLFSAGAALSNVEPSLVVDLQGNIWVAWLEDGLIQVWMSNY